MHTSDALSRLHNFMDTPDQKDVIPLNFLQHFTPHYIEHSYSHLVENLYAHKTKTLDIMTLKRKHSRPPKPKPQIATSKTRTMTAAKTLTTRPQQHPRSQMYEEDKCHTKVKILGMLFISCQLNTSCIQLYMCRYSNKVFIVLRLFENI